MLGLAAYAMAAAVVVYRLTHRTSARLASEAPPAIEGLESHRIRTADGEVLGAWFVPGTLERPVVLLLHGNGGSRAMLAPALTAHAQRGDGVLALSLRAHGDSSGDKAWHDSKLAKMCVPRSCGCARASPSAG